LPGVGEALGVVVGVWVPLQTQGNLA